VLEHKQKKPCDPYISDVFVEQLTDYAVRNVVCDLEYNWLIDQISIVELSCL